MSTKKVDGARKQRGLPPLVIAEGIYDRLHALATRALDRTPDVAERLLEEIERARVVPASRVPAKVIAIGSEITFRDEATGQEQTVRLVFPDEADIGSRRVSVLTPIGAALIGLSEGQRIGWETRTGEQRMLTVLKVAIPAEADPVPAE